jgi:TonB-dependent Receptor Plug Domain
MRPHVLLPLALGLIAAPAAGQVRILGHVISEENQRPLGAAEVTLRRPDGRLLERVETGDDGAFEFTVTKVSAVQIQAKRLGYKGNTTPLLHFDEHRFIEVEVRLATDAILLAPLEVVVWSGVERSPLLDNYRRRLSMKLGTFITRQDIEKAHPVYVSDLLRTVPGVQLLGSGLGGRPLVQIGRGVAKGCQTQIFLDGVRMPDARLDDLVDPGSVEGIEIYKGLSSIPPEFLTPDAPCGVVAVWTRRGGVPGG